MSRLASSCVVGGSAVLAVAVLAFWVRSLSLDDKLTVAYQCGYELRSYGGVLLVARDASYSKPGKLRPCVHPELPQASPASAS